MSWKPDLRPELVKRFGGLVMHPERRGQETAHLVTFQNGLKVRVLPDGHSSGLLRSRRTLEALTKVYAGEEVEFAALVGFLVLDGLHFEVVSGDEA